MSRVSFGKSDFFLFSKILIGVLLQLHMFLGTHWGYTAEQMLEHSPCHNLRGGFYTGNSPPIENIISSMNKSEERISSSISSSSSSTPDSATLPLHAPNSTTLPLPNENGMIIFFLHIPETGGTTIKAPFEHNPNWRYRMVYGPQKQHKYRDEMYQTLHHWQPRQIFYEYHAGLASPYMDPQVREDLLIWKAMAKIRNIPFFTFTVVREPTSFAISHFNFYYASAKRKDKRYYWRPNATEADFLELTLPNPQCLFAQQSEHAYYEGYRNHPNKQKYPTNMTQDQCANVYTALQHDMDWIGTTERMSQETLKLMEQLVQHRYCPNEKMNENWRVKLHAHNLTNATLDYVHDITSYDRDMYDRAQRDFPIEMFSNFVPPVWKINPKKKRCVYPRGGGDGLLLLETAKQPAQQHQQQQ